MKLNRIAALFAIATAIGGCESLDYIPGRPDVGTDLLADRGSCPASGGRNVCRHERALVLRTGIYI